jgi:D-beta-D-heptose 7-phosphate kinase/D-beta-D-heptose 1-phosphate adenosyltransferase
MIGEILSRFAGKKVLVLGDVMLDRYIWGRVERISPEAPVPVLEAQSEESRPGGAANVALNVRSLGATPILVGVVGDDRASAELRDELAARGIDGSNLVTEASRATTVKTRIGAVNQQIVRIDRETRHDIDGQTSEAILGKVEHLLPQCDALIIEDYDKGLLSPELITRILSLAAANRVPVSVDPKQRNFLTYAGVDIFKPNYKELQGATGGFGNDDESFYLMARKLKQQMGVKNLIVTRGSQGMYIFDGGGQSGHLPTYAREVFDVSGAGDTVISAVTLAYISGADIHLAVEIANHAAGVVCGIKGTASVSPEQILISYADKR